VLESPVSTLTANDASLVAIHGALSPSLVAGFIRHSTLGGGADRRRSALLSIQPPCIVAQSSTPS